MCWGGGDTVGVGCVVGGTDSDWDSGGIAESGSSGDAGWSGREEASDGSEVTSVGGSIAAESVSAGSDDGRVSTI